MFYKNTDETDRKDLPAAGKCTQIRIYKNYPNPLNPRKSRWTGRRNTPSALLFSFLNIKKHGKLYKKPFLQPEKRGKTYFFNFLCMETV